MYAASQPRIASALAPSTCAAPLKLTRLKAPSTALQADQQSLPRVDKRANITMASSDTSDSLTPLEQEVLDEYELLLESLNKVRCKASI